ncbi:MAG: hypothetical protein IAE77_14220 [Prosthecobacter sp.]|jgi:hypothetical protein|uniref:sigma factor-like helix-turn-helix DNA-binding protein n=1 Tax=Prosthecobacter sp. TaxID=1965333 RepID=UPI0019DD5E6A|nr:sigma factor-like helix-turn-helix DNA-binding protein [Prosthecobacter sp.]MBE2284609.1 hypothetical protein [Prosthecobacter sp.]
MNHWMHREARRWNELRALAQGRNWPRLPGLTVGACAESVGMEWYATRTADTVAEFLALDGIALIRYPTFGRTKIRRLIEIVNSALHAQGETDHLLEEACDAPLASTEAADITRTAHDGLTKLEIPAALPLGLVRLPVRIQHYCEEHHLHSLGEFLEAWESLGEGYFFQLPNLGRKSVGDVRALWTAVCEGDGKALAAWLPMNPNGKGLSLSAGLRDAVSDLPEHHRALLENRLVHEQTLEEAAADLGVTRERTRQVEAVLLEKVAQLLDWFPGVQDAMMSMWLRGEPCAELLGDELQEPDLVLIEATIRRLFKERPEGAARELELEVRMEGWREKLKQHADLLVEGVDLEEFMSREVPPEYREEFCLSLDGRGRIRLDHATGRVVHSGPRLREVVKAILAREDDPIPLTWLHELVRQTPTHHQVEREQIYRYRIQWKSDDPDFPRDKVLWSL